VSDNVTARLPLIRQRSVAEPQRVQREMLQSQYRRFAACDTCHNDAMMRVYSACVWGVSGAAKSLRRSTSSSGMKPPSSALPELMMPCVQITKSI